MNGIRPQMKFFVLFASLLLLLQSSLGSPQRSTSIQGRYIRPSSQGRDDPKCTSHCSDDRARDTYRDGKYSDDDYKIASGPDFKPKDERRPIDDYNPKPKDDYENPDKDDYDRDSYASSRDEYKPKPPLRVDYNPKPVDRDVYDAKPIVRDEYESKPIPIDDYKPKPPIRMDYKPRPAIRDDYETKPAIRDDYETKPAIRDDYDTKPAVIDGYKPPTKDDEYDTKPATSDGYKPPVRDDAYKPPVRGDGYKPPVRGDGYKPPIRDDGYKPPVRDDGYEPPVRGDGYELPVRDDGYKPPVRGDGYKPPVRGDGYKPPVRNDGYKPPVRDDGYKPPVRDDEYEPKPSVRDDYNTKPIEDHVPKPPARDNYKPPSGGGYYPIKKDDDYKVSDGGYDDSSDGDEYNDYKGDDGKPVPIADDSNCICVPYYQCTDGHIVTDGAGIIDARRRPQPDEDLPLDGKFQPPSCGPFHVCCNTPESSTVKPYEHRCGVRNPSGINSRILSPSNKGEADFGEWPWQAAVLKIEGSVNIFQCGGVLIDKYHVLTVAHCVFHLYKYNDYPLKVRLGEWDTQTTNEFLAHEDYKVSKIIIHPDYKNTSLWNDVAILRLQEPVQFAPHIDTVCLPEYTDNFSGQNCVVTGWGKDSYKGGTFSNIMKEVALQVLLDYDCEEMLRKTRLGRFFQLHEGFVCAGGEHGLDSCKGDGGGPLVCYRKDRSYALAGLVSWGIDCGQPGVPGVYVKIQNYLDWISKSTGVELQDYWPKH